MAIIHFLISEVCFLPQLLFEQIKFAVSHNKFFMANKVLAVIFGENTAYFKLDVHQCNNNIVHMVLADLWAHDGSIITITHTILACHMISLLPPGDDGTAKVGSVGKPKPGIF